MRSHRLCAGSCASDRSRLYAFRGGFGCSAAVSTSWARNLCWLPDGLSEARSAGNWGADISGIKRPTGRIGWIRRASARRERDDLRGKPLQPLDALRNGPAAAIEDQLVHADRGEISNVAGDLFRRAGEGPARAVRRGNAGI